MFRIFYFMLSMLWVFLFILDDKIVRYCNYKFRLIFEMDYDSVLVVSYLV